MTPLYLLGADAFAIEVAHLVDTAMGHKSGGPRRMLRADGTEEIVEPAGEGDSLSDFVE